MAQILTMSSPSSTACEPRWATRRRPERETFGNRLANIAAELGKPFMPWQRYVADVACEIDPETGQPAYDTVFFTVPRQSGKTTISASWQIDRCLNWGEPQRTAFTAHSGQDAREKWLEEIIPDLEHSPLKVLVQQTLRGNAGAAIKWRNDSLLRILSTSQGAGHSKTLHQAVMDEIWHDEDDRREQGLRPAMATIPDAQLIICSTAGTSASVVFNRWVKKGRAAVEADRGAGIAYFEWSAPDDWDPNDEDSWWTFMPALGHTITPRTVRSAFESMSLPEFIRAYGNVPTAGAEILIPIESFRAVSSDLVAPTGKLTFGCDVAEDRASAAIVASDQTTFELVAHKPGTGWLVEELNRLSKEHRAPVVIDAGGPAGALIDYLDNCEPANSRDVLRSCAAMYDAIIQGRVRFRRDGAFDTAVAGAVKKPVGDTWVFSRKHSVGDVTPLMAATLALRPKKEKPVVSVVNLADIPDEDA